MESPKGSLYVEIARCLACRACELACALEHSKSKDLFQAIQEEPRPAPRVRVEAAAGAAIPLQCRHCEEAPCVTICPTEAMHKLGPEQPVLVDDERCIGCKLCIMVCPFGVVTLRNDGKVALKCDLCLERTSEGLDPACVSACKTGALKFLSVAELAKKKRQAAAESMQTAEAQRVEAAAPAKK